VFRASSVRDRLESQDMRAETQALVDEIRAAVALIRRHL
jgi:hypothetical protein